MNDVVDLWAFGGTQMALDRLLTHSILINCIDEGDAPYSNLWVSCDFVGSLCVFPSLRNQEKRLSVQNMRSWVQIVKWMIYKVLHSLYYLNHFPPQAATSPLG